MKVVQFNQGLRDYMLRVYQFVALGLFFCGASAFALANSPELMDLVFGTSFLGIPSYIGFFLAPMVMTYFFQSGIATYSQATLFALYLAITMTMGLTFSIFSFIYTGESIQRVFFITASTFGAFSVYGYTTNKDLTGWGDFLFMGLFGLIISGFVNWFFRSPMVSFVSSVAGVIIFVGFTAWHVQKIKDNYTGDEEISWRLSILGALVLFLDFVNIFVHLLQLLGEKKKR